jgi:short subunit dehydrogenase-like uncharacterized protein
MTSHQAPLLTQRALLLLFVAFAAALGNGLLLHLTGAPTPACVIGGGGAFLATLTALHNIVS